MSKQDTILTLTNSESDLHKVISNVVTNGDPAVLYFIRQAISNIDKAKSHLSKQET